MTPVLAADSLEVTFRVIGATGQSSRIVRAVRGVSFKLARGETLGIVGESGSGKSTVARTIVGLNRPTAGVVRVDGSELAPARGSAARAGVQMVFQDHATTLNPFQTIAQIIDDVMRIGHGGLPALERRAKAERLIQRIGMDGSALERRPSSFSGGQRQRISIARALSAEPRILICDEPTSALDVSVQAQILDLLASLKRDGLSMVFISHNLAVVRQVADRIAVMHSGLIVEEGPAADLIASPAHPYTRALINAAPLLSARGNLLARMRQEPAAAGTSPSLEGCTYAQRCPRFSSACTTLPAPLPTQKGGSVRCHHPLGAPFGSGEGAASILEGSLR